MCLIDDETGKPTEPLKIYIAVDVYSRMPLAVTVGFDSENKECVLNLLRNMFLSDQNLIASGMPISIFMDNNKEYKRYRNAFKRRSAGFFDDEFWGEDANGNPLSSPNISNDALIRAQKTLRRNKEVSLLITLGIYVLNIIDANVDAHLLQYNIDDNLALKPHFNFNEFDAKTII